MVGRVRRLTLQLPRLENRTSYGKRDKGYTIDIIPKLRLVEQ